MEGELKLRVAAVEQLTQRIRMIELAAVEGELPPFEAGAHLEFRTGAGVLRSYSIANDPRERHRYVVAVLREPEGIGSAWMHDALVPGAMLETSKPRCGFALDESASEHLLLAGGIGITPVRAMAYRLRDLGAKFRLVYCTRSAEHTAFRTELVDVFGQALHLHHDEGDPARSIDLAGLLAERRDGTHLYVCGPRGMIDAARRAASHWPPEAVHYEVFASPTAPAAPPPSADRDFAFEIELQRSGVVLTVPPGPDHPGHHAGRGDQGAARLQGGLVRQLPTPVAGRSRGPSRRSAERRGEGGKQFHPNLRLARRAGRKPPRDRPLNETSTRENTHVRNANLVGA